MSAQEIGAYAVGLLALAYIVWRRVSRRAGNTCCGEKECPAARKLVDRL